MSKIRGPERANSFVMGDSMDKPLLPEPPKPKWEWKRTLPFVALPPLFLALVFVRVYLWPSIWGILLTVLIGLAVAYLYALIRQRLSDS
jgi:hypothetical protein